MPRVQTFYLHNRFDQPIDGMKPTGEECLMFECSDARCLSETEMEVSVRPPIEIDGEIFDKLHLASRHTRGLSCVYADGERWVELASEMAAVIVSPLVYSPRFPPRLSLISTLPKESEPGTGNYESGWFSGVVVTLPHGRVARETGLLDGWAAHVQRLADEMVGVGDPDFYWGAFDYYAALLIRSSIHSIRGAMPEQATLALDAEVASSDNLLRTITEPDEGGIFIRLIQKTLEASPPDHEWWWSRIPIRGPARLDIESNLSD